MKSRRYQRGHFSLPSWPFYVILAIGIALTAVGLGGMALVTYIKESLNWFGWTALVLCAVLGLVLTAAMGVFLWPR